MNPIPPALADDSRLAVALAAARAAARIIRRAWRRVVPVELKAPKNYVTAIDRAAEKAIVARVFHHYPDDAILTEETPADVAAILADPPPALWVVDPLDGTTNFVHRHPFVSVSIGFARRGVVTHGVVLDVGRRDVYLAVRGAGAYRNGEPIAVSHIADPHAALVGIGTPYDPADLPESIARIVALRPHVADLRRDGSCALDLAGVAAARLDAFVERPVYPWDIAAGSLLVEEAGGVLTDAWGDPLTLASGGVCATNPALAAPVRALVARDRIARLTARLEPLL